MTVPHCYLSVVRNTLEISIEVSIGIKVKFIVTGKGTRLAMRSSTEVSRTSGTKVTPIVTCDARTMGVDTIVKTMGSAMSSVSLIDLREAMGMRGCDVNMGSMRRSGSRDRGKTRTRSDTRTSGGGITMTPFVTPFTTIVTGAMEGGPKRL